MGSVEDRVLEYLDAEGPHAPKRIADDDRIRYSRQHVNTSLLKLAAAGFVEKDEIGRGVYSITEQGRQYLTGEFDARDVERPD